MTLIHGELVEGGLQIQAEASAAEVREAEYGRACRDERRRLQAATLEVTMLFGDAHQARKNLDASSDESKSQLSQIYVALSRKREPILTRLSVSLDCAKRAFTGSAG